MTIRPYCPPEWKGETLPKCDATTPRKRRPSGHYKKWTAEERETLRRELESGLDWDAISKRHGRQLNAVRMQASLLGLRLAPGVQTAPWEKAKKRQNARKASGA